MTKERKRDDLTEEELEAAEGEPLPNREAMSVIRGVEPLPQPVVIEPVPGVIGPEEPPPTT